MMIHIQRDGQQFGPYTLEDLNQYLADGSLLPSDLMAPFTSGQMTKISMPSRPIPKGSPKARGPCVGKMLGTRGALWRSDKRNFPTR